MGHLQTQFMKKLCQQKQQYSSTVNDKITLSLVRTAKAETEMWERSSVETQKQNISPLPYRRAREFSEQLELESSKRQRTWGWSSRLWNQEMRLQGKTRVIKKPDPKILHKSKLPLENSKAFSRGIFLFYMPVK